MISFENKEVIHFLYCIVLLHHSLSQTKMIGWRTNMVNSNYIAYFAEVSRGVQ